jgi:hypothetical protein
VIGGVNKEEREIQCDCLKIIVRLNMFNLVVIFVCKSFFFGRDLFARVEIV